MDKDKPAFEIFNTAIGYHIKIYADGRVEGLAGKFGIINRIPLIKERAQHETTDPE